MNEPMIRLDGQARRFAAAGRRTRQEQIPPAVAQPGATPLRPAPV